MVPDIIPGVLIYLTDTLIERRKERNWETLWVSLVAHTVKTLPAVWETCVRSLGQKDPLEEGMVTCSSILAWRILWIEEHGGLRSMGLQRVRHGWVTNTQTHTHTHRNIVPSWCSLFRFISGGKELSVDSLCCLLWWAILGQPCPNMLWQDQGCPGRVWPDPHAFFFFFY